MTLTGIQRGFDGNKMAYMEVGSKEPSPGSFRGTSNEGDLSGCGGNSQKLKPLRTGGGGDIPHSSELGMGSRPDRGDGTSQACRFPSGTRNYSGERVPGSFREGANEPEREGPGLLLGSLGNVSGIVIPWFGFPPVIARRRQRFSDRLEFKGQNSGVTMATGRLG